MYDEAPRLDQRTPGGNVSSTSGLLSSINGKCPPKGVNSCYSRTRRPVKQRDERTDELAQIPLHTTRDLTTLRPFTQTLHGEHIVSLPQKLLRRFNYYRREKSIRNAHHLHRLKHERDYLELDHIVNKFRASGGLKHEFQAYKLWCLKDLLTKYQPRRILEFGSGSSTLILSNHVRENDGILLSIDEDERWASNTANLVAIDKDDKIEIRTERKTFISDANPPEIKYDIIIEEEFDFVLIDGPSLQIDGIKRKDAVNSNVFELPYLPQIIVVDVRRATAEAISRAYGDKYDTYLSDLFTGKPVTNDYNYFSVFTASP